MTVEITGLPKVGQMDLRVGDEIFAVPKALKGERVMSVSDSDGDVETVEDFYSPDKFDFYLVKRAQVALPTKPGSVIRVSVIRTSGDPQASNWMLNAADIWVSHHSGVKSPKSLKEFIESNGLTIEVLV